MENTWFHFQVLFQLFFRGGEGGDSESNFFIILSPVKLDVVGCTQPPRVVSKNGSSVGISAHCTHALRTFGVDLQCSVGALLTKLLHRSSGGSLSRVCCWLGRMWGGGLNGWVPKCSLYFNGGGRAVRRDGERTTYYTCVHVRNKACHRSGVSNLNIKKKTYSHFGIFYAPSIRSVRRQMWFLVRIVAHQK